MDIVDWDGWFHEKNGYGGLKKNEYEKWVCPCMESGKVMR